MEIREKLEYLFLFYFLIKVKLSLIQTVRNVVLHEYILKLIELMYVVFI